MFKGRKIIGIIPARGGSKRLPKKNILGFCGKPMIAWTIIEAKKSRYLDDVVVSTNDKVISEISKRYGASVPFARPKRLASDKANTADVLIHAINRLHAEGRSYDIVVLLQPTSPLRKTVDIDEAIELLFKKRASAIVSVCRAEQHPFWMGELKKNGSMNGFFTHKEHDKRSQDLPAFYRLNGAVYVIYSKILKRNMSFYGDRTFAYVMPEDRSADIDNDLDLRYAEFLAKERMERNEDGIDDWPMKNRNVA